MPKYVILFQQIGRKCPKINLRQEIKVPVLDEKKIKIPEGFKIISITSWLPVLDQFIESKTSKNNSGSPVRIPRPRTKSL